MPYPRNCCVCLRDFNSQHPLANVCSLRCLHILDRMKTASPENWKLARIPLSVKLTLNLGMVATAQNTTGRRDLSALLDKLLTEWCKAQPDPDPHPPEMMDQLRDLGEIDDTI